MKSLRLTRPRGAGAYLRGKKLIVTPTDGVDGNTFADETVRGTLWQSRAQLHALSVITGRIGIGNIMSGSRQSSLGCD
jgi:hypothetical protein